MKLQRSKTAKLDLKRGKAGGLTLSDTKTNSKLL